MRPQTASCTKVMGVAPMAPSSEWLDACVAVRIGSGPSIDLLRIRWRFRQGKYNPDTGPRR